MLLFGGGGALGCHASGRVHSQHLVSAKYYPKPLTFTTDHHFKHNQNSYIKRILLTILMVRINTLGFRNSYLIYFSLVSHLHIYNTRYVLCIMKNN